MNTFLCLNKRSLSLKNKILWFASESKKLTGNANLLKKDFFDSKRSSSPENNEDLYVLNHLVNRFYPLEQSKNPAWETIEISSSLGISDSFQAQLFSNDRIRIKVLYGP